MHATSQYRFVQTKMPGGGGKPGLSSEVKFLAMYSEDDGRLAILAQVSCNNNNNNNNS